MKWTRINRAHFNLDLVQTFHWAAGKLIVWLIGDDSPETFEDPKRENYLRLCHQLGIEPIPLLGEEDADG